jgi:hypothetical protein
VLGGGEGGVDKKYREKKKKILMETLYELKLYNVNFTHQKLFKEIAAS